MPTPTYLFFWDHTPTGDGPGPWLLSQWWPLTFSLDGVFYAHAEQFMMAEKARVFGDEETRGQILASASPERARSWDGRCAATTPHSGSSTASTW